ncbi:hypothetical protein FOZ62_017934, partial [Perkinsus olseni]
MLLRASLFFPAHPLPPQKLSSFLMIANRAADLIYLTLTLLPTTVFCLTSQKQKSSLTPDPSKLEYRLAGPSDILIADKENPTAGLFVAVDPKDH